MGSELEKKRQQMVSLIRQKGITDERVLNAMSVIPREKFVLPAFFNEAYEDHPLSIGYGQTISQPYIIALMTRLLSPLPNDVILEIGTGSGYQAAILSLLCQKVYTVERIPELARKAENTLAELGIENVQVFVSDGTLGLPEFSPYDGIIVTAASPQVPASVVQQLKDGGRLVIPVGERDFQSLLRISLKDGKKYTEDFGGCVFVPLIGKQGWRENIGL
ncbi:protein-L-isoaspartate O-methyltransferase [bacterium Unc6]|nr:protein-L-isoaspartate O-methyltransferase [bacterium Unc6]